MHELELYYEAMRLRKLYGPRARLQASLQSSRALSLGDLEKRDRWDHVRSVVAYLEQVEERSAA